MQRKKHLFTIFIRFSGSMCQGWKKKKKNATKLILENKSGKASSGCVALMMFFFFFSFISRFVVDILRVYFRTKHERRKKNV